MTNRLRAAVMGTPAERDLDALLGQLETLRLALVEIVNVENGVTGHGNPYPVARRALEAVSSPANVQGAPTPSNGDAETSGTSGRPAPDPAKSP
jgi:hypothetical protein